MTSSMNFCPLHLDILKTCRSSGFNHIELRFGIREFAAITSLKCSGFRDFISDPSVPNRLLNLYFPGKSWVTKAQFYEVLDFIKQEDIMKMTIVFFISSFLFGTGSTKWHINKKYVDLMESGQYVNYTWGEDYFRSFLMTCSHKVARNPSSFFYGGFHLAAQIWFYEYCNKVDPPIARHVNTLTPRILNWETSSEAIQFDYFQRTMFRRQEVRYI